jgi:hypothetical protein
LLKEERRIIMAEDKLITALSPEAERVKLKPGEPPPGFGRPPGMFSFDPSSITMADRPDSLKNKTLYLVDIGFGGGYNFMLEVERWFNENMPSVKTVPRRKPGHVFSDDDNSLWEEVKEKGDAVVLGVAG